MVTPNATLKTKYLLFLWINERLNSLHNIQNKCIAITLFLRRKAINRHYILDYKNALKVYSVFNTYVRHVTLQLCLCFWHTVYNVLCCFIYLLFYISTEFALWNNNPTINTNFTILSLPNNLGNVTMRLLGCLNPCAEVELKRCTTGSKHNPQSHKIIHIIHNHKKSYTVSKQ